MKTVHVEKEVFRCNTFDTPAPDTIFEVSIYTEIIEDLSTKTILKKKFDVITCAKDPGGSVLGCKSTIPSTTLPTGLYCGDVDNFPKTLPFPIEMNTVAGSGTLANTVKTIEAEKEVFNCDTPQTPTKIKDVIIFTEIFEDLSTQSTVKRTYLSATCVKAILTASVIACRFTTIT